MNPLQKITLFLLAFFLCAGCAVSDNNLFRVRSEEARKIFESSTVVPDHTYYYTGPSAQPDAIIAIDNKYTLQESVHWNKVDITEKQLQDWNRMIDNYYRMRYPYKGACIMTPDGQKAGLGFSKYSFVVIKFPGPNQITIWPPEPDPMQRRWENKKDRY